MVGPSPHNDPEWTCVRRGKGGAGDLFVQRRDGLDRDITPGQLEASFDKKMRLWRQSSARSTLLRMLQRHRPDDGWGVEVAVCLAVGSFSTLNVEGNGRSLLQCAVFVDLAAELGNDAGTKVTLFAQDPVFSPVDKDFLTAKGVTLLHDGDLRADQLGEAKQHFGPGTLLCEFFMDMGSSGIQDLLRAGNTLYIGSSFQRHDTGPSFLDGHSQETDALVERFRAEHVQKWFPEVEEDPNVFKGLMVYWREEQDSDAEG